MDVRSTNNVHEPEDGVASTVSTMEQPGSAQTGISSPVLPVETVSSPVEEATSTDQTVPLTPSLQTVSPIVQATNSALEAALPVQPAPSTLLAQDVPPTPPRKSPVSAVRPQLTISAPTRHVRSRERMMEEDAYSVSRDYSNARNGSTVQPSSGGNTSGEIRPPGRSRTVDTLHSGRPTSRLDWIVPVEEKVIPKLSVGERLQPTLTRAHLERDKYAIKAKMTGYTLNAAIGMQVLLGSLTTGLSAAAATGKQVAIAMTAIGALSTMVASYLARARGSNEPELSITRVKDLEQFIRECDAFQMDHGHNTTDEQDEQLHKFRWQFEELLGNASGERKLSPPV